MDTNDKTVDIKYINNEKKSDSEIIRITKQKGNKIIIVFFYILVFLLVKVKTQMCLAYSRI